MNLCGNFLNSSEIKIVSEAIYDHRGSLKGEPRSIYGKILASADRSFDFRTGIIRTHNYSLKHFSEYTLEEMIKRAFDHLVEKYVVNGDAISYVENDEYYLDFINTLKSVQNDYSSFRDMYLKIYNEEFKEI